MSGPHVGDIRGGRTWDGDRWRGPSRAVVTPQEMAAAADLVEDLDGALTRHGRIAMVAAAFADVREGVTLPGERLRGSVHLEVSARMWADEDRRPVFHRDVRRRWAGDLEAAGLRPLGWPPVTVTYWRMGYVLHPEVVHDGSGPRGFDPLPDAEGADLVRLTIDGLAVKA